MDRKLEPQQGQTGVSIFINQEVLSVISVTSHTLLKDETLRTLTSSERHDSFKQYWRSISEAVAARLALLFVVGLVVVGVG